MSTLFLIFIIALNVAISWWNCYAVGSVWRETRAHGSTFDRMLLWSGAIQSVAGFSIPILLALTWAITGIMSSGANPTSPEDIRLIWESVMNLWYVAIIIPVVGSGFIIWAHSVKQAYERRDFGSIAVAGYNTFAQASNTMSMFNNMGGALSNVGSLFKGRKGNEAIALVVILLVVVALLSSALLTAYLIQHYADKAELAAKSALAGAR